MLKHARLRREREVTSRAVANSGNDFGATFAGRRHNDRDIENILHRPFQSREIFHSWHFCIEQHEIEFG
jgi:hypothetical protein